MRSPCSAMRTSASEKSTCGSRLLFWLLPFVAALIDSGYWSGVVYAFSISTPSTRASWLLSVMSMAARYAILRGRAGAILRGMDVVLVHPEIPHNSGCAGRLTAAMGARLHLVEPLGFSLEDRYLKRAGLDYWPLVDLTVHPDVDACFRAIDDAGDRPLAERLRLFTARRGPSIRDIEFAPDDVLVFGCESAGLPAELVDAYPERLARIPIRGGVRSLNLANAIAIALFVATDEEDPGPSEPGT